ncbi:MAG: DNA translocase FtsK 4TM domain-containing protein [Zetaproteobacteria bacterium]|nr:DNA translocase FtsK 4TM domain-containing protein [Zetaproteobacteria bacterium]
MQFLVRESIAFILLMVTVFIGLSLFSFSPNDPSLSYETSLPAHNSLGFVGAYLADFLYQLWGYTAWALLLLMVTLTYRIVRNRRPFFGRWTTWFWLPSFLCLAVLFHLHQHFSWFAAWGELPSGSGGFLGTLLGDLMVQGVQPLGANLIAVTLGISSFVIASHISLIVLAQNIALMSHRALLYCKDLMVDIVSKGGEKVQEIKQRKLESQFAQAAPIEEAPSALFQRKKREPIDERNEPTIHFSQPLTSVADEGEAHQPPLEAPLASPSRLNKFKELVEKVAPVIAPIQDVKVRDYVKQEPEIALNVGATRADDGFTLPSIQLFKPTPATKHQVKPEALQELARDLENKLMDYRVEGKVVAVQPGPVVVQFELEAAPGTKVSRIITLQDDLARSMAAISVRVAGNIPGKNVIGIELPNEHRQMVSMHEVLVSPAFSDKKHLLPMALGVNIAGQAVVVDLAKMPHLLVAGTTGSGKSVSVNTMICSLLMKHTPQSLRLIMVDPKMLELSMYNDIPHLLVPVVTSPHKAAQALAWAVYEMERRYQLMSQNKVRNLAGFNELVEQQKANGEDTDLEPLPFIVILIDELADLMMVAGKEVEQSICRLAQKARAAGLHLILATQRPSVDVITGLIKANLPSRLSFQVSSKIDSRTVLDQMGAEQLLGMGDSLFLQGGRDLIRVHGAFVSDAEVIDLVDYIKTQGEPNYHMEMFEINTDGENFGEGLAEESDSKYDEAAALVIEKGQCSVSMVQRFLRIGYNRASRIVEQMEQNGLVTPPGAGGIRKVLGRSPLDGFE